MKLEQNSTMSSVRTVLQACLLSVNMHGSSFGSSGSFSYGTNISKFRWSHYQTVSSFTEGKNLNEKPLTLCHTMETTATVFPLPYREIKQHRNNISKLSFIRSLNSHCMMKKQLYLHHGLFSLGTHFSRPCSSDTRSQVNDFQTIAPTNYAKETTEKTTDYVGKEWGDVLNDAQQSLVSAAYLGGKSVKEVSVEVTNYMQQLYETYPYLQKVIIPVGGTALATLLAWFVMPKILRKFHKYGSRNPLSLLSVGFIAEEISYEKSLWSALEDPVRYLFTFMAFYELGIIIAPTTSQYLPQAWRSAVVLSFVWFLHRWKTNVFARAIEKPATFGLDRDKLLTIEKLSSMGLLVLGVIALAEACGVAVQSILTVGGIGGVATAFAARDVLGNILSGLSLQFSKPFSLGDTIKAGSVEGQVVEMGLTTTSLMNPEKFPVIVPNSLFSSQVIVNKSRAQFRACIKNIPIQIDDIQKVPHVTEEIKLMLCSNPRVSIDKDTPYCFLSRIESSFLELTLGCNLKYMKKDEIYATEQNILLQAATIIVKHGAKIGSYH